MQRHQTVVAPPRPLPLVTLCTCFFQALPMQLSQQYVLVTGDTVRD